MRVFICMILLGAALFAQRNDARLRKELEPAWIKWVNQDVAWIITDDELKAFQQLGTDDEREQFVEQFWLRRDPTPDTAENEYKEEHYRRIAYANQHFPSGIPGWKTDRGRIYIRFGPPDEIESHPSGGTWQRPPEQGGGSTSTYPFELWRYRHLDDVGDDIVVQFVDASLTGEYSLTLDPCANDALLYVPGAGPTQAEQLGLSTRTARFQNTNGTHCGASLGGQSAGQNQFDRLRIQTGLQRAPAVKFKDLQAQIESRVSFNVLPMQVQVDYLRVTDASVLANVTVQFEKRDLEFQTKDGVGKYTVHLLGRVSAMSRRPVATFEKPLEIVPPAADRLVFQQAVPLAPGRYKLDIAAQDVVSGNMAHQEIALDVPRFDEENIGAGSLILADTIQPLTAKNTGAGMFAIGDVKVRPRIGARFSRDEKMGIYMQIFNTGSDNTGSGAGTIVWQIDHAQEFTEILAARQLTIAKLLSLKDLSPGAHSLRIRVKAPNGLVEKEARFTVIP